VAGNNSKVADGGSSTFLTSTAMHGLTRDISTPRMGSRASSFSHRDPSLVKLLREAVNWCSRCLHQLLGFNLKRAEIQALWLPIYRCFGLISKRIRLRSHFDPTIKLVSTLVRSNPKGTNFMCGSVLDSASALWWSFFGPLCGLCTGERPSARLGQ
jgi:hypothetical protein